MASKNHIYIHYLPAIRYNYTYLNLNADVMFVLKREIAGACPGIRNGGGGQKLKALFCFSIFQGGRPSSENS